MHGDLSMARSSRRCTVVLIPLLWVVWNGDAYCGLCLRCPAIFNGDGGTAGCSGHGRGVGWLDHLLLALSEVALTVFFLIAPSEPITA